MLNNINNEDILLNNSLTQQIKLGGVEKKASSQNPYSKVAEYGDVIDISDKAKELYEKEKEIEKYKSLVMDSLNTPDEPDALNTIMESVKSGEYISNEQIADKMLKGELDLNGSDLLKMLLSHPDETESGVDSELLGADT